MKITRYFNKLSTKLLTCTIAWVVCAIFFTGYALALLWQLENAGIAINYTGSLRMRVYYMMLLSNQNDYVNLQHEQTKFITILNKLKKYDNNTLIFSNNKKINLQIKYIEKTYNNQILPLINQSSGYHRLTDKNYYHLNTFVEDIDLLVKLIENQNTQDIIWLRYIITTIILMILITAFSSISLLYKSVINPLKHLESSIKALSQGNLSKRIPVNGNSEFDIVSSGFNQMAHNLQDLYNNLEHKVSDKTLALKKKNHELTILYDMITFLHTCLTPNMATERFLEKIIDLSQADAGFIGFLNEEKDAMNFICSQGFPAQLNTIEQCYFSANCFFDISSLPKNSYPICVKTDQQENCLIPSCVKKLFSHFIIFPIWHNKNEIGLMVLYFKKRESTFSPETYHLIETLTCQLGVSIENYQLTAKEKQLAIMEERNLIAQGLHDSIAQALSFLNLQAQMLEKAINKNDLDKAKQNLDFIQRGVQESYDDVRELLMNFRTKIGKEDFETVVKKVVNRFKAQTKIPVKLINLQKFLFITKQQQLQIIFILQEALSNIRKHSKCKLATIEFSYNNSFMMRIHDDGVGFDLNTLQKKQQNHIGLSIIQERAENISGKINITSTPNHGTTLELTIPINL